MISSLSHAIQMYIVYLPNVWGLPRHVNFFSHAEARLRPAFASGGRGGLEVRLAFLSRRPVNDVAIHSHLLCGELGLRRELLSQICSSYGLLISPIMVRERLPP